MFNKMDAAEIGAMAAGQAGATGPLMMFAQVGAVMEGSGSEPGGGEGGAMSKEETDDLGGRLQHVSERALSDRGNTLLA